MENDMSFWSLFVCITVTITMLLMVLPRTKLITYTVFGSFLITLMIDYFAESSLKYIFITVVRRILIPGFRSAFVFPPYQTIDKAVIALWFLLMAFRLIALCIYCHCMKKRGNGGNGRNNSERTSLLPFKSPSSYTSIS